MKGLIKKLRNKWDWILVRRQTVFVQPQHLAAQVG